MKQKRIASLTAALLANLSPVLAQDATLDPKAVEKILVALDSEPNEEEKKEKVAEDDDEQRDGESDEDYKKRMEAKPAQDDDEPDDKDDKKAMDAAIKSASSAAVAHAVKRVQAIHQAEKDVLPLIGEVVAQDSAEAVYKLALDHAGIDVSGVHPSAYAALVKMHASVKKPAMALDTAGASDFWAQFPNAVLPTRS
jgi:hypothetical protein